MSILAHTAESYGQFIFERLGKGRLHAQLLYKEWLKRGTQEGRDPAFRNARALHASLCALTDFSLPEARCFASASGTKKYGLLTHDGHAIEMVLLPMQSGVTLCLSSQIGCQRACAFCETGRRGLIRSLTVEEITAQLFVARHLLKAPVRNIVFMGMGEPLDNYEATLRAITIFSDMQGFGIGAGRITVSTSGLIPQLLRLAKEAPPSLKLALSLNGSSDAIRSRLMPINRRYNMGQLREAICALTTGGRRKILIEYILIRGMTDSLKDAEELAAYLSGLRITLNLIPYNPQSVTAFERSLPEEVDRFAHRLKELGVRSFIRGTKGDAIMAACGQLGSLKT